MPGPIAVLDANVLYPMGSRDFFMWVHLEGVYQPKWTTAIHDEWIRNVAENEGIPRAKLQRCRALMDQHASSALVTGWKRYLPQLERTKIDPKDRHVVAAALKAQSDAGDHAEVLIITSDVRHFPIADLQALGLSRMQPDAFAFDLFRHNPHRVLAALYKMRAALRNPPFTTAKFLSDVIGKGFPRLVEAVAPFRAMI